MTKSTHGATWKAYEPEYLSKIMRERLDGMEHDDVLSNTLIPLLNRAFQYARKATEYTDRDALIEELQMLQHLTEDANNIATYLFERTLSDYEF